MKKFDDEFSLVNYYKANGMPRVDWWETDADEEAGLGAGAASDAQAAENDAQSDVDMEGSESLYDVGATVTAANQALDALGLGATGTAATDSTPSTANTSALTALANLVTNGLKTLATGLATVVSPDLLTKSIGLSATIKNGIATYGSYQNFVDALDKNPDQVAATVSQAAISDIQSSVDFGGSESDILAGLQNYTTSAASASPEVASALSTAGSTSVTSDYLSGVDTSNPTAVALALYQQERADQMPYYNLGINNLDDYQAMLSGEYDMTQSPAAQYALEQGNVAQARADAARGISGTGGAASREAERASSIAASDWENQYQRLLDAIQIGSGTSLNSGSSAVNLASQTESAAAAEEASAEAQLPYTIASTAIKASESGLFEDIGSGVSSLYDWFTGSDSSGGMI
jgi:hypothetical protein